MATGEAKMIDNALMGLMQQQHADPGPRVTGIVMNVTVSARSTASARAFGPRTVITTGVWKSGPSSSLSDLTASRT